MEQLCGDWTDFVEIWYLSFFRKIVKKIKFHENRRQITVLYMKTDK